MWRDGGRFGVERVDPRFCDNMQGQRWGSRLSDFSFGRAGEGAIAFCPIGRVCPFEFAAAGVCRVPP